MAKKYKLENTDVLLGARTLHRDALDSIKAIYEIERGSNSNGSWVKYSDGTMECLLDITRNNIAFNSPYGSMFLGTFSWVFPQIFISEPNVTCIEFRWGTGISISASLDTTNTQVGLRGMEQVQRSAGTNVKIKAEAKGRWKV